jgi:hypothetical protein
MNLTKKTHYNPCFWTAHWNDSYRQLVQRGAPAPQPRKQRVQALSVKTGRCFQTNVENVHFDKHLGLAEITCEAAEAFARRYHPDKYERFRADNQSADYPLLLDFENVFSGLEGSPAYGALRTVIRREEIASAEEKAFLACFIVLQQLRSHAIMNASIQWQEQLGRHKFEHLVTLKWLLSDAELLNRLVSPVAYAHWTLYVAREPSFPLCDSPVLVSPRSIMIALSPTLLLEILPEVPAGEHQWRMDDHVSRVKTDQFRRRTIGNTFREIIFGNGRLLDEWQHTPEFSNRVAQIKNITSYNKLVDSRGATELWLLNAFGNQS